MKNAFHNFSMMNEHIFRSSGTQFQDYIFKHQEKLLDIGEQEREKILTIKDLESYSSKKRTRFIQELGGLTKSDGNLNAKVTRVSDRGEFFLENIIFQSRPQVYVTANLYLPKNINYPAPAILFLCGHWEEGRMGDQYYEVCQILTRAGLIVFAIDPTGQGERSNYYDPEKRKYVVERAVADHNACGVPAIATGKYLESYFLCDQMRAIDYMLTRPEIDGSRIGVTGNSGGGTQTISMMICDERIAAAAPATFVTNRKEFMYTGMSQDMEQIWPACAEYGFDHVDALLLFAPKPIAVLALTSDFFPIEGTRKTVTEAKRIYKLFDKEEYVRLYEDDYWHNYTKNLAVYAAEFFSEIFYGEKKKVDTDHIQNISEEELYATKSGNVLGEIQGALSIQKEVCIMAEKLRDIRMQFSEKERKNRAKEWLKEKIFYRREPVEFNLRYFEYAQRKEDGFIATRFTWWIQNRLFAGGVIIKSEKDEERKKLPTVIALWEDGTKRIEKYETWIRSQCQVHKQVLVLDLPGNGQLEQYNFTGPYPYRGNYGPLYHLGCDLIFMGDSMAAFQTYGVIRTVDMLEKEFDIDEDDISIYCDDLEGVYGIMTTFLKEKVHFVPAKRLVYSVEKRMLGKKLPKHNMFLNYIVPGMLEYFDYDELIER